MVLSYDVPAFVLRVIILIDVVVANLPYSPHLFNMSFMSVMQKIVSFINPHYGMPSDESDANIKHIAKHCVTSLAGCDVSSFSSAREFTSSCLPQIISLVN